MRRVTVVIYLDLVGITEGLPHRQTEHGTPVGFTWPTATGGGLVFLGSTSDARFPGARLQDR
jgi:hypothetical protein